MKSFWLTYLLVFVLQWVVLTIAWWLKLGSVILIWLIPDWVLRPVFGPSEVPIVAFALAIIIYPALVAGFFEIYKRLSRASQMI
jgi:hypothetical protein